METTYVDQADGLARLRGNTSLYYKMLALLLESKEFAQLEDAIAQADYEQAAHVAHSIKGMTGNLSLPALFASSTALVELFRAGNCDTQALETYRSALAATMDAVRALLAQQAM